MKKLFYTTLALLLIGTIGVHAQSLKKQTCNLVFIGNSITEGALHTNKAKTAPPVFAAEFTGKALSCNVNFRNCGRSGATTVDFLPAKNADFKRVRQAIKDIQALSYEPIIFSIMLGTNDSANFGPNGSPVSNNDYKKNLTTMINEIRRLCPNAIFVLQQPIWYSPNTHNASQYLVAGQKRMIGYTNILIELAAENKDIYLGDCDAFDFFSLKHKKFMFAENGQAGVFYLHPNERGAKKLAKFWSDAIVRTIRAERKNK